MDGLKQRIIGALVLVSLAVIFVPMIFDEPHSERTSTPIQIPEEPPFPEVNAPSEEIPEPPVYETGNAPVSPQPGGTSEPATADAEPVPGYRVIEEPSDKSEPFSGQVDVTEETESVDPGAESGAVAGAAEESTGPAANEAPGEAGSAEYTRSLEGAWVIQLGSFGNPDNARRLRDRVREKGYGSHLQELTRGDTVLTRVFSGPFASKSEAEAAKRVLDDAFNLNSLVTEGDK